MEPTPASVLTRLLRNRRMCRDFLTDPLDPQEVVRVLDAARRAPSAGFAQGLGFVVLDTPATVDSYWSVTLAGPRRAAFGWPGLLDAPVLVTLWVRPQAWVERYTEPDKARTGLGAGVDRWPVPYWWIDTGCVIENLLLLAEAEGWGALLFGMFEHEGAVARRFGVPDGWRGAGTVALGWPRTRSPGRSAGRGRPELAEVVFRGAWGSS